MLSQGELERYNRQMMIQGFGEAGQEKLKRANVFIAGAGGLGCPVAIYLAAAGVGHIRIVDHDVVQLSNLNRQILHWAKDIDRKKVDSAQEKLRQMNPDIVIETSSDTIAENNVCQLTAGFDLVVDAMDNLPTRYLLNQTCIQAGIPFFHGAVYGFEGRATTVLPGKTACLSCIYRSARPQSGKFPVIGVTPAIIACIEATEVIKYIVGIGELLTNRLLIYDGLNMTFTEFRVEQDPECEYCGHLGGK